jgi:hypothetical protein
MYEKRSNDIKRWASYFTFPEMNNSGIMDEMVGQHQSLVIMNRCGLNYG